MISFPAHIFKAYDIRGKVGSELSSELCTKIGRATAQYLPTEGIVAVGRDMREDSEELTSAVIDGLRMEGRDVWDIGQVTSDMIYFAVGEYDLAGGVVVTASHNGKEYNGIKIYRDKVTPVGLDSGLAEIRDLAEQLEDESKEKAGNVESKDITTAWVDHCLSMVDTSKWPQFSVAIDAGNGMAGKILPEILPKLPLKSHNLYFELDGSFPNHEANPQKPETLEDLIKVVLDNNLDFGIAFDGDGDRAGFVDDKGRPVLGTDVLSIVAGLMLQRHPGAKIVHDVRTSRATKELITEWGGEPVRTKAGRVYIGKLVREIGAAFGGETTGHLFFTENFDADSGMIAGLMVIQSIAESGKKLSELVDEYRRYEMPPEINYSVNDKDTVLAKLKDVFNEGSSDELDGLTYETDDFWFNLRASNTEPLMRLNIEGKDKATVQTQLSKIENIMNQY